MIFERPFQIAAFSFFILAASISRAQRSDPALAPPPSPPPSPAAAQKSVQPSSGPGAAAGKPDDVTKSILQGIIEDYKYDPTGKRDPFMPFTAPRPPDDSNPFELNQVITDLQRFDLDQLKLVGIMWDVRTPRAMFLDPSGKTYVVTEQDKVGRNNGYIADIREGELVVVEKFNNQGRFSYQTRILKLQRE